ncbi:Histone deacetylase-like amidohydrolase [Novipirellula galeiformis]|uniref:Histone deacetylase-like amidohydrolase n=1 Tax=Novipirellula galeiformis TaxID=2528004 RepID=A0A5C6CLV4_9BACT|nr:histone deacetylase [Novipirellula galeiformis]TWU24424.1 Histone deacetylase-like amidohydrolase [Novipirellula galeiformis]
MTLLYYDYIFQEHDTGSHPESALRLAAVMRRLSFLSLDALCQRPRWEPASIEQLSLVHTAKHIENIRSVANRGGGEIDSDTVLCQRSYDVAAMAAGAVADAVRRVVAGDDVNAFCLVRPPGHHASQDQAMGFCLFNNVAVGARVATQVLGLDRVMIVDFDVHHGNGTQAIFYDDPRVGFLSMHRAPLFPHTGSADETGSGAAVGTTVNVPISLGTSPEVQIERFSAAMSQLAKRMSPQLILISAGFDSHRLDPVGSLGLNCEDFTAITREIIKVARQYAEGRIVSVLEGGYNPDALAECVGNHLETLMEEG